jgi:hypothetical protein
MELILNLFWIFLTVPALWLWRNRLRTPRDQAHCPSRFLLILGCLLILLFPVISASDDLRAVRLEAEDPAAQDTLRGSFAGKSSQPAQDGSHFFALPEVELIASIGNPVWRATVIVPAQKAGAGLVRLQDGRAPPLPSLG